MLVAPVIVWATPIVHLLFGHGYERSANVLRLLSVYIFLVGLGPLITTSVNYLGQASRRIWIVLAALAVNIVIDVVLVPVIGVTAGAIGTGVAYAILTCRRISSHLPASTQPVPLRPLAHTLARSLFAAAAMGAVLLAIGTDRLTVLDYWFVDSSAAASRSSLLWSSQARFRSRSYRRLPGGRGDD